MHEMCQVTKKRKTERHFTGKKNDRKEEEKGEREKLKVRKQKPDCNKSLAFVALTVVNEDKKQGERRMKKLRRGGPCDSI